MTVTGNITPEAVLQTVSKTGKKTSYWEEAAPAPAEVEAELGEAKAEPVEAGAKPAEDEAKPAEAETKPAEAVAAP